MDKAVQDNADSSDEGSMICTAVGQSLRRHRLALDLTLRELCHLSKVSAAMISRIEHGQVSPSLATLEALARSLEVPVVSLFEHTIQTADINFVKAGEGLSAVRHAPNHAHSYRILGRHRKQGLSFESISVIHEKKNNGTHPTYLSQGFVFITISSGSCLYNCGDQQFSMETGDSICFDAQLKHGVKEVLTEEVTFISVAAKIQ